MTTQPQHIPNLQMVPLEQIQPSPTNPRKRWPEADQQEMVESIKAYGVMQPIILRAWQGEAPTPTTNFEIVAGERRYRGSLEAEREEIPAIVRELGDREVLELQMVENMQRTDLTPLEEADGLARMLELRDEDGKAIYSVTSMSLKLAKSKKHIYRMLALTKVTPEVRALVEAGELGATQAQLVARIPDPGQQVEAAEAIAHPKYEDGQLSVRSADALIRREYTVSMEKPLFDPEDATLKPSAGACSACPHYDKPDGKAGGSTKPICRNGKCHQEKAETSWRRLAEGHREAKATPPAKILDLATSEEEFWGDELRYSSSYVVATQPPCPTLLAVAADEADPTLQKTWKSLCKGKGVQPYLARDGHGKVRVLYKQKEALAAAKLNGHEKLFRESKQATGGEAPKLSKAEQEARDKRNQLAEERLGFVFVTTAKEIVQKAEEAGLTEEQTRMVVSCVLNNRHGWWDELGPDLENPLWDLVGFSRDKNFKEQVSGVMAGRYGEQLMTPLLIHALCLHDPFVYPGSKREGFDPEAAFYALAQAFGYDPAALGQAAIAAVEAQLKAAAEAEAKTPLAAPAKKAKKAKKAPARKVAQKAPAKSKGKQADSAEAGDSAEAPPAGKSERVVVTTDTDGNPVYHRGADADKKAAEMDQEGGAS